MTGPEGVFGPEVEGFSRINVPARVKRNTIMYCDMEIKSPKNKSKGRPRGDETTNAVEMIRVRITKAEKAKLQSAAKSYGMSMSQYILAKADDESRRQMLSTDEMSMLHELMAIGANVNQIARALNAIAKDGKIVANLSQKEIADIIVIGQFAHKYTSIICSSKY